MALCSARRLVDSIWLVALLLMSATVAAAEVLPSIINTDMTLTAALSPWELQSDVTIAPGADVTIEPDVRIIAQGDFRLTVSGSITAMSSAGTRIVFRAPDANAVGAWKGLYFTPGSTGCFQRCTFRSAADNIMIDSADVRLYNCDVRLAARDGLYGWGDAFIKTAYCRFQNNGRYGVDLQTSQPEGAVIYSEFVGNGAHPVRVKASCLEMLRGGNIFQYNAVQAIGVDCAASVDIEDTDCWNDQGLPLDMTVGAATDDLTIGPTGVLRIRSGVRIYPPRRIVVRGKLLIDGLADARVVIQPQGAAQPGDWLGMEVEPGALARLTATTVGFARVGVSVDDADLYMANVVVRDCQEDGVFGGGTAHVDLAGCTITDCGANGLHLSQPDSSGKVRTTHIANCGAYPVRMAATVAEALRDGNTYAGNARQAIGTLCGMTPDIADDDAWLAQGVPFDLTADPEGTQLSIGAGARLSLRAGVQVVGGGISAVGILVAAGTQGSPVSFDSAEATPAPGDWAGIEYVGGSAGRLVNAVISYGDSGVVVTSPGGIRLENCEIRDCQQDGVRLGTLAMPLITGCTIRDNGRWGIGLFGDAAPLLGSSSDPTNNPGANLLFGNGLFDLANNSSHAVLAQRNWWGTTDQAEIARHILDQVDNAGLGPANFVPYLSAQPAPVTTAVASAPQPQLAIIGACATPTGAGAAIQITLSRPARVRAIVRNIAGRSVRELTANVEERSAVIPWDGRDLRGNAAAAGRYLVEVEALAEDGGRARAMTGLTLIR